MIVRSDLLALDYYKKAVFTGSEKGMRYRVERIEEDETPFFLATVWPEPYNFVTTPDEQKTSSREEFSEEGLLLLIDWMNEQA